MSKTAQKLESVKVNEPAEVRRARQDVARVAALMRELCAAAEREAASNPSAAAGLDLLCEAAARALEQLREARRNYGVARLARLDGISRRAAANLLKPAA